MIDKLGMLSLVDHCKIKSLRLKTYLLDSDTLYAVRLLRGMVFGYSYRPYANLGRTCRKQGKQLDAVAVAHGYVLVAGDLVIGCLH